MTGRLDNPSPNPRGELRPWTDEARAQLRLLHAQKLSNREIASRLGRTAESVSNMSRWLGLRRRNTAQPWTACQLQMLERLVAEGCSLQEVAKAIGHPRASVADKLRQLKIKSMRSRRPWSDKECGVLLELHATGASIKAIVVALSGRSADAVQQKLYDLVGPSPFRTTDRKMRLAQNMPKAPEAPAVAALVQGGAVREQPPTAMLVQSCRPSITLVRHLPNAPPAPVPASVDDIIRWLRSRDYMVLHSPNGWRVDRSDLKTSLALFEFTNTRRTWLSLPPFVMIETAAQTDMVPTVSCPNGGAKAQAAPYRIGYRSRPRRAR